MTTQLAEPPMTAMLREAGESGSAIERLLEHNRAAITALGERLRERPPTHVVTCARGSSDHAATYGKYLIETRLGTPTASVAPSVLSIYAQPPVPSDRRLCIAISQSGRSPDLLASVTAHQAAGAHVVALVNDTGSPLFALADTPIALMAGAETSVAATKSYIAALAGLAAIVAAWSQDDAIDGALLKLPALLRASFDLDWSTALDLVADRRNLFVIGRGLSLGVAQEAALKLKETCGLHAEAFSSAEVRHGPMAIVGPGFPILAFATSDEAGDDVRTVAAQFESRGARVALVDPRGGAGTLPAQVVHPVLEPILMIQSFYRFANALSLRRGLDPDAPPHLQKVTSTR